jgi:hypothetical protein
LFTAPPPFTLCAGGITAELALARASDGGFCFRESGLRATSRALISIFGRVSFPTGARRFPHGRPQRRQPGASHHRAGFAASEALDPARRARLAVRIRETFAAPALAHRAQVLDDFRSLTSRPVVGMARVPSALGVAASRVLKRADTVNKIAEQLRRVPSDDLELRGVHPR